METNIKHYSILVGLTGDYLRVNNQYGPKIRPVMLFTKDEALDKAKGILASWFGEQHPVFVVDNDNDNVIERMDR